MFGGVLPPLPWIIVVWRGFELISALCSTPAHFWNSLSSALALPAHFVLSAELFMQTDFIICWVYWELGTLWGAAAWHEAWHRLRAVIQDIFVSLKYVGTAFENPWGRSCCAAPQCESSGSASLGSSLHHLWRDKRLILIIFLASGQPAKLLFSLSSWDCAQ